MPLLKNGKIVEDTWTNVSDADALPAGAVVVSLERWLEDHEVLVARPEPVGVRLMAGQSPALIEDTLDALSLVALEFPAFTDGRSYSYARLLHRLGFSGEIRAVGNVLRDQFLNMKRCGFDTLEIKQTETESAWEEATGSFTAPYQSAFDAAKPIMSLREQRMSASK